jgi:hypothetical protein
MAIATWKKAGHDIALLPKVKAWVGLRMDGNTAIRENNIFMIRSERWATHVTNDERWRVLP